MRKILGFLVSLFAVLPLVASAEATITPTCGEFDSEGIRTCIIKYKNDVASDSITVTLTEKGGAEVLQESISGIAGGNFYLDSATEENGVWSAVLSTIDPVTADYEILSFKYKNSGTEDCKVSVSIGDISTDIGSSSSTVDKPEDQKQLGTTLPYVALGVIGTLAAGVYFSTKNKTKMYKI